MEGKDEEVGSPELGVRPDHSMLPVLPVDLDEGRRGTLVEKLLADLKTEIAKEQRARGRESSSGRGLVANF